MKLAYEAYDGAGQTVHDMVEAASLADGIESLRRQGLFVTQIEAGKEEQRLDNRWRRAWFRRSINLKDLAVITRQLHVLISTGTPLTQALAAIERQTHKQEFRRVIAQIRCAVEEGSSLSDAMYNHPQSFDRIYCSLIAAGESSGKLSTILHLLSSLTQQRLRVRNTVFGAMTYPCLLVCVSIIVVMLMIVFVMPRFTSLFASLDAPLPPSTVMLMVISSVLRTYWWAGLLGLGGSVVGLMLWMRTAHGKRTLDTAAVRLPLLGRFTRSFSSAKIARLLAMMLDSHLPLLETLKLVREAMRNSHYAAVLARAEDAATQGKTISSAFCDATLIDPSFYEAMRNGEMSGKTATILMDMADFMDADNEILARSLASLLEPIILIVLGLVVGLIAVSMFLPLFDLTSMATGGGA